MESNSAKNNAGQETQTPDRRRTNQLPDIAKSSANEC